MECRAGPIAVRFAHKSAPRPAIPHTPRKKPSARRASAQALGEFEWIFGLSATFVIEPQRVKSMRANDELSMARNLLIKKCMTTHLSLYRCCLLLLLAWVACGGSVDGTCDGLARDECRKTIGCFLDYNGQPSGYFCRAAKDVCERQTNESGLTACEGVSNCAWEAANCYCPEGFACYCSGGPPAACRKF